MVCLAGLKGFGRKLFNLAFLYSKRAAGVDPDALLLAGRLMK